MTLYGQYAQSAILQAIHSKSVKVCVISIIPFGITALLVSFLLPIYRGLVYLFCLTILCNTFIPIAPQEPVILLYGKLYAPWIVAICAGVAITVIELINYQILVPILNLEKIRTLRGKWFYQRAEHYFSKYPFSSLVFACFSPVPFIPFRILAVTTSYSVKKFLLSIFVGRVPRFYLLALTGKVLNLPIWVYGTVLVIAFSIVLVTKLAERRKGNNKDQRGTQMGTAYRSGRHIGKTVWRCVFRNFILRDKPFFAHMVLTKRCNLHCVYCKAWQEPLNPNELSTSEWLKVIDTLDKLGVYVLSFTGGEPLLKPGVFDLIRYARSKGLYTRLTSNGMLPQRFYQELIDSGINSISISLDSVEPDTQESLSQVRGSWRKTMDTLKFLRANAGPRQVISVCTMVTPHNIHEIIPIVDLCSNVLQCPIFLQPVISGQMSSKTFAFRPADEPMFKYRRKDVEELYRKLHRKLFNSRLITPYTFLRISQEYLQTGEYKWKCRAGRLFFDIMPDGTFYLCQDVPFPAEKHVLEDDFVSWFRSKSYQETARQICADCVGCCYSCYVCTQHLFSWRLPDTLGVAIMNTQLRKPI